MRKMINNFIKDVKVMGVVYKKRIHKLFTEHPNSTENPQGYWAHCLFSFTNSVILMWFCLLGIIHSFFPFVFEFNTSSAIIRSFKKLVDSNRHGPELIKYGFNVVTRQKDKYGVTTIEWKNHN